MLPNHGSVQGELFPGSVVCDARTQGLHEGPFTVIFRRKLGGMRWRRTLALAWPKLACLTWLAGEGSAQRLLTVLASYIIDSTPAAAKVCCPDAAGSHQAPTTMKIVDLQPRCFSGSLGPLCPRPSLKLAGVLAQRGDLIARRRDWSRGLHDLRHVGMNDRRQSILGDIGWGSQARYSLLRNPWPLPAKHESENMW